MNSSLPPGYDDFYSHAREGRDSSRAEFASIAAISTHTPARGVTKDREIVRHGIVISTHTPARGVTLTHAEHSADPDYFYSHAREGRDRFLGIAEGMSIMISTHTPARGVTWATKLK